MDIPFSKVTVGPEESEAVQRVLASGWLAAGPETEAFEREFAEYVGVKYAIFTNSCTSALKMSYKWAKEQGYLAVHYPGNTFCATYSAAIESGLACVKYNNNSDDLIGTKAFRVNMHYGGVKDDIPCLIEDSAHRIEPNDPLVGRIRCYSFYATKNMTTGSGGMLVTDDKEIYDRCRLYWKDGLTASTLERSGGPADYEVIAMAGGYDGNDLGASIGRCQLRKLPQFTERRNRIVERYNKAFEGDWKGNHLYPCFVRSEAEVKALRQYLHECGIGSGYHYPGTGWLGVSLPLYPLLTDGEAETVISRVLDWREHAEG